MVQISRNFLLVIFLVFFNSSLVFSFPNYSTICAQLEEIPGWNSDKCEGVNVQGTPMGNMVSAQKRYIKGNKQVDVAVFSGMNAMGMWAPYQNNMQVDSTEQFIKVTKINGYNVAISYEKKNKTGGIVIGFNSKKNPGMVDAVLVFNFSNMHWKDGLEFAKKFDWDKIRELFK